MLTAASQALLQALDPNRPLDREELNLQYVDRTPAFRARLAHLLATPNAKVFISGQSGSGKSTELARLDRDLDGPMHCCVTSIGASYDLTTIKLNQLFAQGTKMALDIAIHRHGFVPSKELASHAGAFGFGWDGANWIFNPHKSTAHPLAFIAQETAAALRELETAFSKPVVLLYDGLEKVPLATARDMFCTNSEALAQWPVRALFVVPPLLLYTPEWQEAEQHATGVEFLPALYVAGDDAEATAARAVLRGIAEKRLGDAFQKLDSTLLDEAITLSGGLPRQFLQLFRSMYLEAFLDDLDSPDRSCLQRATSSLRHAFALKLTPGQQGEIEFVRAKRPASIPRKMHALLAMSCVIQYRVGEKLWHDVNPVL